MQTQKQLEAYESNNAQFSSEQSLLLQCYDRILQSASNHETESTAQTIKLLKESLSFRENPKLALHLMRIYRYLENCLEKDNFPEVCRIIEQLRDYWHQAFLRA